MANTTFARELTLTITDILIGMKPTGWTGFIQKFGWKLINWPPGDEIIRLLNIEDWSQGQGYTPFPAQKRQPLKMIRRKKK